MGSNISIVNETNDVLHICLSQLCPLYFANYVRPGQCFSRNVGKVWFTIEVKLASDGNEYSTTKTISECCLLTAVSICTLNGGSYAVGDISISSTTGRPIYSPCWYMGYSRRIEVRCQTTNLEESNEESAIMKKFYLVEVCPSGCGRESKGVCSHCS